MTNPSPETHVFVGMFRPLLAELLETVEASNRDGLRGYLEYQSEYGGIRRLREDWLLGHFDTPVYKTIEEVVRMRNASVVETPQDQA